MHTIRTESHNNNNKRVFLRSRSKSESQILSPHPHFHFNVFLRSAFFGTAFSGPLDFLAEDKRSETSLWRARLLRSFGENLLSADGDLVFLLFPFPCFASDTGVIVFSTCYVRKSKLEIIMIYHSANDKCLRIRIPSNFTLMVEGPTDFFVLGRGRGFKSVTSLWRARLLRTFGENLVFSGVFFFFFFPSASSTTTGTGVFSTCQNKNMSVTLQPTTLVPMLTSFVF